MSSAVPVLAQLDTPAAGAVAAVWAARVGVYLSVTLLVGQLLAASWLLRDAAGDRLGPMGVRAMRGAALCAGLWACSAAAMFVFGLANATARPVTELLDAATLARFLGTRFGAGMVVQAAVAAGVCLLAAVARDRTFARVALGATAAGVLAHATSGHAGTSEVAPLAVASATLHILAAAAWVGGLVVVAALVLPGGGDVAGPARRFSRLAGWALGVVLATGAVNSLVHVEGAEQLLATAWGRLVLVKLALFCAIAGLGWLHRRRSLPRLGAGAGARRVFRRLAAVEVGLMVAAFGTATAMASGTPARVEWAAQMQLVRLEFADGLVELSLSPARTGSNELHVYFFDASGGLRQVDDAAVTLTGPATVQPQLVDTGPGHLTGPAVEVPEPGRYRVAIRAVVDGGQETATTTLTVR